MSVGEGTTMIVDTVMVQGVWYRIVVGQVVLEDWSKLAQLASGLQLWPIDFAVGQEVGEIVRKWLVREGIQALLSKKKNIPIMIKMIRRKVVGRTN